MNLASKATTVETRTGCTRGFAYHHALVRPHRLARLQRSATRERVTNRAQLRLPDPFTRTGLRHIPNETRRAFGLDAFHAIVADIEEVQ